MNDSFYPTKADDPRNQRIASLYLGSNGKWTRFWKPGGNPMYPFAWGSQTLYSTPADYARFLTLWLDGGKVAGKQLLSKDAVQRILTPVSALTTLGVGTPYPTGFAGLHPWYGQLSMEYINGNDAKSKVVGFGHGGSDGTGAWAFPDEDLIVCYFTQSRGGATTIRIESIIQDALLHHGAPAQVPDDLKPCLGTYYANFGPYRDTPFQILYRSGRLALDIPDQLIFALKSPDKNGLWQFDYTDIVSISFKKDGEGKVGLIFLHEAGMKIEVPREKSEPITKEAAEKFVGKYQLEDGKAVEVKWKDGRLVLTASGQKEEDELFQGPDKKWWRHRQQPGATTTFDVDKAGTAVSFTTIKPDAKKLTAKRVEK